MSSAADTRGSVGDRWIGSDTKDRQRQWRWMMTVGDGSRQTDRDRHIETDGGSSTLARQRQLEQTPEAAVAIGGSDHRNSR